MRLLAIAPFFLTACTATEIDTDLPEPFIGQLVSVNLIYGAPYNEDWPTTEEVSKNEDEDIIIVTNACGYAIADFKNVKSESDESYIFQAGRRIGEWCRNPYQEFIHSDGLVIPVAKNTNREWQDNTYKSVILKVHHTDKSSYADPFDIIYAPNFDSDRDLELQDFSTMLTELGLDLTFKTLDKPAFVRELHDDEPNTLDQLDSLFYIVVDREILLKTGLKVDDLYK